MDFDIQPTDVYPGDVQTLCIPKINNKISREFIFRKLCDLKIGYIQKFTEISLKNNPEYKRILFKIRWNNTPTSKHMMHHLSTTGSVCFVYDLPWFWKIYKDV